MIQLDLQIFVMQIFPFGLVSFHFVLISLSFHSSRFCIMLVSLVIINAIITYFPYESV